MRRQPGEMKNVKSCVLQTKSLFLSLCFRSIGGETSAAPSKDESLYRQVKRGNIAEIRELHRNGAGLEWVDKKGQTPLILACQRFDLFPVAKVLIELGANINAYRPGPHGGTPLHYAAKHGLRETVDLLLSHGANPLLWNDDKLTALYLAREKEHRVVIRSIEKRICLFSGWLRDFHRPTIFTSSRDFWVVVLPFISCNNPKLCLFLYCEPRVVRPSAIILLWKSRIKQPNFNDRYPTVVIEDIAGKTKARLASAIEGDRDQLLMFYNACRGFPQTGQTISATPVDAITPTPVNPRVTTSRTPPTVVAVTPTPVNPRVTTSRPPPTVAAVAPRPVNPRVTTSRTSPTGAAITLTPVNPRVTTSRTPPTTTTPSLEDVELAMAMNASIQSAILEGAFPLSDIQSNALPPASPLPSAPINTDIFYDSSPIHYPSVDSCPISFTVNTKPGISSGSSNTSNLCVICLDAAVEGACIPCGHMAGCMPCLNEINARQWGCPVCRTPIQQVIKLYTV